MTAEVLTDWKCQLGSLTCFVSWIRGGRGYPRGRNGKRCMVKSLCTPVGLIGDSTSCKIMNFA